MTINHRLMTGLSLLALLPALVPTDTHGQSASRDTLATAAATNSDFWFNPFPPAIVLAGGSSAAGMPLRTVLEPRTFTGLDSNNNTRIMVFSGESRASSTFGTLRVRASGELTNTFYNPDNEPFYQPDSQIFNPDGVPDLLSLTAQARFEDWIQFGGFVTQLYVSYRFRITGRIEGNVPPPQMFFQVEGHPLEIWTAPAGQQGDFVHFWATQRYLVSSLTPKPVRVWTWVQYRTNTQDWPEGSNVSGTIDMGNTVSLDDIIVTDKEENIVTEWTMESASGTDYVALINQIFVDRFEEDDLFGDSMSGSESHPDHAEQLFDGAAFQLIATEIR